VDFYLSEEAERFRQEVREFLDREVTPELVAEFEVGRPAYGPLGWEMYRKLGAKGWLGIGLPEEYGGSGGSFLQRIILTNELDYRRIVYLPPATNVVAPIIVKYGTEEQKREFVPRICRGEIEFCLAYSEPEAGSDVSRVRTRAVEETTAVDEGDHYVINGQKMFNSFAHSCQYHWLIARTDPDAPGRKALSFFIVDADDPGITVRPLYTLGGERTNEVFYDNVRVPKGNMVGEKNKGFMYLVIGVDLERVWFVGRMQRTLELMIAYAKETGRDKDPVVRQRLAETKIELELGYLLGYRLAWMQDSGITPTYEAGLFKLFVTEFEQRVANIAMGIVGLHGQLAEGSMCAPFDGEIQHIYRYARAATVWAGTSEMQRNAAALIGLGLPAGR